MVKRDHLHPVDTQLLFSYKTLDMDMEGKESPLQLL